jgi:hypothetical protein
MSKVVDLSKPATQTKVVDLSRPMPTKSERVINGLDTIAMVAGAIAAGACAARSHLTPGK